MSKAIDVFVSYKKEEAPLMRSMLGALQDAGYIAVADLNIGKSDDFGRAIDGMIRQARLTLVLWTTRSVSSEWVQNEACLARDLGKEEGATRYLGVLVEDVTLDMRVDLRGLDMVDVQRTGLDEAGLALVIAAVEDLLGRKPVHERQQAANESMELSEEVQLFGLASEIDMPEAYETYLARFPEGNFAAPARKHLERRKSERQERERARDSLIADLTARAERAEARRDAAEQDREEREQANRDLVAKLRELGAKGQPRRNGQRRTSVMPTRLVLAVAIFGGAILGLVFPDVYTEARSRLLSLVPDEPATSISCTTEGEENGVIILDSCVSLNTTSLNLVGTYIVDLSPLANLTRLKWLDVADTQVSDLAALSGLTGLESLYVANTEVSDLTPLSGLTGLEELSVFNTQVSDLAPLSGLTGLRWLHVGNTQVSDLSDLANLENLVELRDPTGEVHSGRAEVQAAIAGFSP